MAKQVAVPQPILDYMARIGAIMKTFRRWEIGEKVNGYWKTKATIRLNADGSVKTAKKSLAPTDDEAKAIKEAIIAMGASFPTSRNAEGTELELLHPLMSGGRYFPVFDRRDGNKIVMVEERVDLPNGDKDYRPWVIMNDGEWMMAYPDRDYLPFYKPFETKGAGVRIMIHEGPKTAHEAANVTPDHPWYAELQKYEHWGMIGGAWEGPRRADYAELRAMQPNEVVYVCDNDQPGEAAIKEFSFRYHGALRVLRFGSDFPLKFDMADPFPAKLFDETTGNYKGQSMEGYITSATWATIHIPSEGKGKGHFELTPEFSAEWLFSRSPERYVSRYTSHRLDAKTFYLHVAPFSHDGADVASLIQRRSDFTADTMDYCPARGDDIYLEGKTSKINIYRPGTIKPKSGDPKPFIDYMTHLIPNERDRIEVMRWCATLIARPDIRMGYGLLMISEEQGVGKTTLALNILRPLVGVNNTGMPAASYIAERWTDWMEARRLVVINEIYSSDFKTDRPIYNKLKQAITENTVEVESKGEKPYTISNWCHLIATSNSFKALQMSGTDRRWLVPEVTEKKWPGERWRELRRWLDDGGLPIIAWWAGEFLKNHDPVDVDIHAPDSETKLRVIEESQSTGQAAVRELLSTIKEEVEAGNITIKDAILTDKGLVNHLKNKVYNGNKERVERPGTIRRAVRDAGWFVGTKRLSDGWREQKNGHVVTLDPSIADMSPGEMRALGLKPLDLDRLMSNREPF